MKTDIDTLEEALTVILEKESAGDAIYDVRSRASEGDDPEDKAWRAEHPEGNSWDQPRVIRYSNAITCLINHLASLRNQEPTP